MKNTRYTPVVSITRLLKRFAIVVAATTLPAAAQTMPSSATPPSVDLTQGCTLYAVGYTHLDTQWRWTYPQVIREFVANTMRDNFPLFERYPHYIFNWTGSRRYEMMKEYFPEDFAKVKQYVAAGRWWPAGSSADENDVNMPSGESIIRQVLYGNEFFRHEFGVASNEYMLPDCFGFPYSLPSLLAHCGLKGFNTQKLSWNSAAGIPFNFGVWVGPDGKSVLAALNPGGYGTQIKTDLTHDAKWAERIGANGKASGVYADFMYYGTGDRGGAPDENSVKHIEEMSTSGTGPVKVISSTTSWIFDSVTPQQAQKLPHYQGELELTQHSAGSPSSQAAMKRWNRKNELLADGAERASVAALSLLGTAYPQARLNSGWDLVLGSQMHDMMAGTAMPKAYEYCWNDELIAANNFAQVEQAAVSELASQMDTRGNGRSIVVYNPLSIEREDTVEAKIHFDGDLPEHVTVFSADGSAVPTQIIERDGQYLRLLFTAKVPAVGFASFDVRTSANGAAVATLKVTDRTLENDCYQVTVDANGDIASIIDKRAGSKQLLSAPMRLAFMHTRPMEYPAWNLDWADMQKPPVGFVDGPADIKIVESGPVRVSLMITRHAIGSTFEQCVRLSAGSAGERVEVDDTIDWQTKAALLKQTFPLTVANPKATYDIQLGAIERGNNDPKKYEVVAHQWFDLTGTDGAYGVSILNDSKFGSDKPDDNTLRLSLLSSPGVRNNYQDQATQDWGRHQILYAVSGHNGDWRGAGGASDTFWQGQRLNQPLRAFSVPAHEGPLGKTFSLMSVDNPRIAITAIKKAENSDAIIVRLRELTGSRQNVTLSTATGIVSAEEVDGQERSLGVTAAENSKLKTTVDGYSLRAFALKLIGPHTTQTPPQSVAVALPFDTDAVTASINLKDGGMDTTGRTYPAENFPKTVMCGPVKFNLGSTSEAAKNAVSCNGQSITLPADHLQRIFILAAANNGDAEAEFDVGGTKTRLNIQDWGGYIGNWDNRVWGGNVPELTYEWYNPLTGLEPGFVKPASVAWYCSHRHHPDAGNEYYEYSYLYQYELMLPQGGAASENLTLPNNPKIKIFAITAVDGLPAAATPLMPLFDTLADHQALAAAMTPTISVLAGSTTDAQSITIAPPLYWHKDSVHYTLDGIEPTAQSPLATDAPISIAQKTTVMARVINGKTVGPITEKVVEVNDTTPPTVSGPAMLLGLMARVRFSEPIDPATAADISAYRIDGGPAFKSAKLSDDGREVILTLASKLEGAGHHLHIAGLQDRSPAHNGLRDTSVDIQSVQPVFFLPSFISDGKADFSELGTLPAKAHDKWTMNCWVKADQMPADRTLIAGFGKPAGPMGTGRYFAKHTNGIHFNTGGGWKSDMSPKVPFEVGQWMMLTATCNGDTLQLYKDGVLIGERDNVLTDDESSVHISPAGSTKTAERFIGEVRDFSVWNDLLSAQSIQSLSNLKP